MNKPNGGCAAVQSSFELPRQASFKADTATRMIVSVCGRSKCVINKNFAETDEPNPMTATLCTQKYENLSDYSAHLESMSQKMQSEH